MRKRWERLPEGHHEKEYVAGSGSFTNEYGEASLSGNTIKRSWSSRGRGFLTLFALLWNSFVSFIFLAAWNGPLTVNGKPYDSVSQAFESDPTVLIFLLFPFVGFCIAYISATMWINKTRIKYSYKGIEITRGPLPWPRSKVNLKASNISQFYVQVYSSHTQNKIPVYAYRVVASQLAGEETVIEDGLSSYNDARILEQWLESKLNIEDKAVVGEFAS